MACNKALLWFHENQSNNESRTLVRLVWQCDKDLSGKKSLEMGNPIRNGCDNLVVIIQLLSDNSWTKMVQVKMTKNESTQQ